MNYPKEIYYLPHPKNGGKVLFSVCQFTPRRGRGSTPSCLPKGKGCPPSQVRMGGGGVYPTQVRTGVPHTRSSPIGRMGVTPPPSAGWGTPLPSRSQVRTGGGGTPNWNSIAYTCYAAGGMPLAFTFWFN